MEDPRPLVQGTLASLTRQRVLPVVRAEAASDAVDAALSAVDAGLSVVELTATTPDWETALQRVRDQRPSAVVGLGTVTNATTARTARSVGASFLVSPWPSPEVRDAARAAGVAFIEGAFSPGEVAAAAQRGPVKVFPASILGPDYLRSLLQLLPEAVLLPTGGIALDDVSSWLDAGATAVGVGRDLSRADLPGRLADIRGERAHESE